MCGRQSTAVSTGHSAPCGCNKGEATAAVPAEVEASRIASVGEGAPGQRLRPSGPPVMGNGHQ